MSTTLNQTFEQCPTAAKYYCAFLKTLKMPQCPCEFTMVLQGNLGHSMGNLGLKMTDLAYMVTL